MKQILLMIAVMAMVGCNKNSDISGFYTLEQGNRYSEQLDVRDDGTYVFRAYDSTDDKEKRVSDQWSGQWEVKKGYLEITVTADKLSTTQHDKLTEFNNLNQSLKDVFMKKVVGTHRLKIESNGDLIFMERPDGPYDTAAQTRLTKK